MNEKEKFPMDGVLLGLHATLKQVAPNFNEQPDETFLGWQISHALKRETELQEGLQVLKALTVAYETQLVLIRRIIIERQAAEAERKLADRLR